MAAGVLADTGIPMLALQWPAMFCVLIPVVLIEAVVVWRRLGVTFWEAVKGVGLANLFSTIVGVPLAWAASLLLELAAAMATAPISDWIEKRLAGHAPLALLCELFMGFAWMVPDERNLPWLMPGALGLLLIPSYFVSVWLENWASPRRWKDEMGKDKVKKAVTIANRASYGLLFVLAWAWMAVALLCGGYSRPFQ